MRSAWWVVVLACNSGSSSSSPSPPSPSASPRDAALPALLAFDPIGSDALLAAAFGTRAPRLPAVSADGERIASLAFEPGEPGAPVADFEIASLSGSGSNASSPLFDGSGAIGLRERGTAIIDQLRAGHFVSLSAIRLDDANGDGKIHHGHVGSLELRATLGDDRDLVVALVDRAGAAVDRVDVEPALQAGCGYRPTLGGAYVDPQLSHIYLDVALAGHDACNDIRHRFVVWDVPAIATPDGSAVTQLLGDQLGGGSDAYAADARVFFVDQIFTRRDAMMPIDGAIITAPPTMTLSRDGASAWVTATARTSRRGLDTAWRISDLVVRSPHGWRIASTFATEPRPNDDVDRDAKAGKLVAPPPAQPEGDASLLAAFAKLASDGLDATAAARTDLVAIGSGPGERTIGGAVLARAWNALWKAKLTIATSVAGLAPSGTTGWVAAHVALAKSGYAVPFALFCVFDKTASGAWTLVHVHFGA
jgi:hypothetical protein